MGQFGTKSEELRRLASANEQCIYMWDMKDYLELRKEELKKRGNKGFTLMEMLIAVLIAVLIAIAIPVFTGQLQHSQLATDAANIRSEYSEKVANALLDQSAVTTGAVTVDLSSATAKFSSVSADNTKHIITVTHNQNNSLTQTFNVDSGVTITIDGN